MLDGFIRHEGFKLKILSVNTGCFRPEDIVRETLRAQIETLPQKEQHLLQNCGINDREGRFSFFRLRNVKALRSSPRG